MFVRSTHCQAAVRIAFENGSADGGRIPDIRYSNEMNSAVLYIPQG